MGNEWQSFPKPQEGCIGELPYATNCKVIKYSHLPYVWYSSHLASTQKLSQPVNKQSLADSLLKSESPREINTHRRGNNFFRLSEKETHKTRIMAVLLKSLVMVSCQQELRQHPDCWEIKAVNCHLVSTALFSSFSFKWESFLFSWCPRAEFPTSLADCWWSLNTLADASLTFSRMTL